jgi:hypothetical protein
MEVLQKAELAKKTRPGQLPALEGLSGKGLSGKPPSIKGFDSSKPVKVVVQSSFNDSSPAEKERLPKEPVTATAAASTEAGLPPRKISIKRTPSQSGTEPS